MLSLLNVDNFSKNLIPVTTSELFSRTGDFHSEGLFSEKIFGVLGSDKRKITYSYILLPTYVIHPTVLRILKHLDMKIEEYLSGDIKFIINSEGKIEKTEKEGLSGIQNFIDNFSKIRFRSESEKREGYIDFLNLAFKEKKIFINKIPIIPPELRPAYQDEDENWTIDTMNDLYITILNRSKQIETIEKSGELFTYLNWGLQKAVIDHDEFVKEKIQKKDGLIRYNLMGKRIDFSGRAVITPGPDLKPNEVGLPFRMAIVLFEPFIIHRLLYSGLINKKELDIELMKFIQTPATVESITKIIKMIKNNDKVPEKLFNIFYENCEIVMNGKALLMKRDPVLQLENYRAVYPILHNGQSMNICNLTVGGYSADYDGDSCLISITYRINDKDYQIHISELENKNTLFKIKSKEEKNGKIISKFEPLEKINIKSINPDNGNIDYKTIKEFSKHENLEMYKIESKNNDFETFWSSSDHSLIIYDELDDQIKKITPKELIEHPEHRYLIKEISND